MSVNPIAYISHIHAVIAIIFEIDTDQYNAQNLVLKSEAILHNII